MQLAAPPVLYVMIRERPRSLAFWCGVLGAVLREETPFAARLVLGAQPVDLVTTDTLTPSAHPVIGLPVADIVSASQGLASKGIAFIACEGLTEGPFAICRFGARRLNWFADPDGNILGLVEGAA